ncbi:hypothetical protein C2845_PM09G10130 [Panicum miliaceum]|uniref:Uncharacterized protein n=1 Tax=Panicum miliaceum TaxID=4540 RepID=A0A3L6S2D6_PANMI|nr:hypothetical protein C2845_PM09G10130 [Panicum miliaceum]
MDGDDKGPSTLVVKRRETPFWLFYLNLISFSGNIGFFILDHSTSFLIVYSLTSSSFTGTGSIGFFILSGNNTSFILSHSINFLVAYSLISSLYLQLLWEHRLPRQLRPRLKQIC